MTVQAMDKSLDRRFVEMTQIRCGLTRLLAHDNGLWCDESEGINDDFALDGLDGVDHDGNGARGELFEGLLGVDIDGRKPATETGVRVVPANDRFRSVTNQLSALRTYNNSHTGRFASKSPSFSFERQDPQPRHSHPFHFEA